MARHKLKDPADEGQDKREDTDAEMAKLDPKNDLSSGGLSGAEVGNIPASATRGTHPFEGYPLGRKIMVGEREVSTTHIVLLRDPDSVPQDESGKRVSHEYFKKGEDGKDKRFEDAEGRFRKPQVKNRKIINLKTYHSRVTVHPVTGDATDTVFDREVMVDGKPNICAIVKSHSSRASICMLIDKKGVVRVDTRYTLADTKQIGRLRRVFDSVNYQQMRAERSATKFDSDPT